VLLCALVSGVLSPDSICVVDLAAYVLSVKAPKRGVWMAVDLSIPIYYRRHSDHGGSQSRPLTSSCSAPGAVFSFRSPNPWQGGEAAAINLGRRHRSLIPRLIVTRTPLTAGPCLDSLHHDLGGLPFWTLTRHVRTVENPLASS
jgi:hypothetical protein